MKQLEAHCLNHHHKSYSDLIKITEQSIMTLGDFMNDGDEDEVQRGRITFGEQND
jgi:phage-related protein